MGKGGGPLFGDSSIDREEQFPVAKSGSKRTRIAPIIDGHFFNCRFITREGHHRRSLGESTSVIDNRPMTESFLLKAYFSKMRKKW